MAHRVYEDVLVKRVSDSGKALLIQLQPTKAPVWVPVSVIDLDESDAVDEGDVGTVAIAEWFAEKEGLPEP